MRKNDENYHRDYSDFRECLIDKKLKIGLVAEFNPFHNGHAYLMRKIKELYPNSEIIVALSSDFVQRGEMACAPFSKRAEIAKEYGASKVVPLDFLTSTQAAHIFAKGSIDILLAENIDLLVFGASDSGDINKYISAANWLNNESEKYNSQVRSYLKQGKSYVASTYQAMIDIFGDEDLIPKDILGFEYVKYIINNNLPIKLNCIKRTAKHSSLEVNEQYASATLLREMLSRGEDISKYSPMKVDLPIQSISSRYEEFKEIITQTPAEQLANIMLVSEGMENLFKKNVMIAKDYDDFISLCSSRRYTKSRIKRVFLYILLEIKKA
ncbi:nucleotidyltransferase [Mycoplasma phocoeninasale]|uniref:nucleotidyltransferase n=1 Tax=Mycoplasma phocoeninasale TaxID=2726117 RepID=UPI0019685349|nr:nucleotidyltransferase [Mycoplasma phocoeninasale]MBN0970482.1 nucleotidyltransferase [Mycoplasma phocoeninasale]